MLKSARLSFKNLKLMLFFLIKKINDLFYNNEVFLLNKINKIHTGIQGERNNNCPLK